MVKSTAGYTRAWARRRGPPPVPGPLGHAGGQVSSGAVAGHPHALGIPAELLGVGGHPGHGGGAVVEGGREAVLGGEAVVDAHHHGPGASRQDPARPVVGVDVTDDPAPAVEEGHDRDRTVEAGPVDAEPQGPGRSRDGPVLHLLRRVSGAGAVERPEARPEQLAKGVRRELREVDRAGFGHLVEDQLGGGFGGHGRGVLRARCRRAGVRSGGPSPRNGRESRNPWTGRRVRP